MNSLPAKQLEEWGSVAESEAEAALRMKRETYRGSLKQGTPVHSYLLSKGWLEDDIQKIGLGYCAKTQALVIPVTTGQYEDTLHGFIYRSVATTKAGYVTSHSDDSLETSEILVGDPRFDAQDGYLLLVSDPLDLYRLRSINFTRISAAIVGTQISERHAKRLSELKPRRILFIRGTDATAKGLEESVRKFCLNEVIELGVVALDATDVSEYLRSESVATLAKRIESAKRSGGLLDRTARTGDELLSWLAAQPPALKTGYTHLDKKIRIPVGAVTIVAGRPKHGKTTLLYNLMLQMIESGLYDGKKFYFFSYEENGYRIKQKILSRILEASDAKATDIAKKYGFTDIRSGEDLIQRYALKRQEEPDFRVPALDTAIARLDELLPRFEVVNERLTVEELDRMIRRLNEGEAIGAIFIDYMQRIPTEKERNTIRENMNTVSDVLKWCAVNTGLPLIVGAQINRTGTEKVGRDKKGKRPAQTDIKESGNLEEDANLVLGVYNETQATIDDGDENAISNAESEHVVSVYTLNSRDSEPSETKFVMTNRLFREG